MAIVKLGDIAMEAKSSNKGDKTGIKIVGLEHLTPSNVTLSSWSDDTNNSFTKEFSKGDVLFGRRRAYLKKAAVAPFDGICSGDITVIRAIEDKVDPDLLPFIIQNDFLFDFAVGKSAGSLSPRVKWTHLKEFTIDIPSMPEQRKLAKVLWAIYDMKDKYKKLILATDELVKSQFIEMFGDVKEHAFLEDCCSIHARVGWQALKKDEYMEQGEYMLITGTDFVDGRVDFSTCVYVSKERYDMDEKIQVRNGDILVTKDGTIGKVAIVEGLDMPATLNAGVFVIRPDGRFDADFFSYLFKGPVFSEFVEAVKSGATIKHLNQGKLQKYEIPQASMELQKEFAELYRQSDKSKFALQDAIKDLDALSKKIIAENLIPAGKE